MTTEKRRRQPYRPSPARLRASAQRLREQAESEWTEARRAARQFLADERQRRRERLAEARQAENHARALERLRAGLPLRQAQRQAATAAHERAGATFATPVVAPPSGASMSAGTKKHSKKKQGAKKSRAARNGANHARA